MIVAEFAAPECGTWLVAGLSHEDRSILSPRPGASFDDVVESASAGVLFLEGRLAHACNHSLEALLNEMPEERSTFIALVPRVAPPQSDSQYDRHVHSFLCSPRIFARFLESRPARLDLFCFQIMKQIIDREIVVDHLLVRQIPSPPRAPSLDAPSGPVAVIIPHRGSPHHLRSALAYLDRAEGTELRVRVGLDVDDNVEHYRALAGDYPAVEFFQADPSPVGPYVIRQELAERSPEPLLGLQDADDVSCSDRFVALHHGLLSTGSDMIGSHALMVDEMRQVVYPVRFPLDASAALGLLPNHAQLHATIMVRRDAFFASGGLATDQIIANDTQFLFRSYFSMRVRNVDEFLYICRRHAVSLTNAPETRWGTPLRAELDRRWSSDFNSVKAGEMALSESSLRAFRRVAPYRLEVLA